MVDLHTISAGGVVINTEGKVLIVSQHGNSWSLPKGHVEKGEDLLSAAKREIAEESGIIELVFIKSLGSYERFRIGRSPGEEDHSNRKTLHFFLFKTKQMALKPTDPENPEARWIDVQEVSKLLTHPKDKEFFQSCTKYLVDIV